MPPPLAKISTVIQVSIHLVYFPIYFYFYFYFSPYGEKEYTSLQKLNYVGFLSVKIYIHNYKQKKVNWSYGSICFL